MDAVHPPGLLDSLLSVANVVSPLIMLWFAVSTRNERQKREVSFTEVFAAQKDLDELRKTVAELAARMTTDKDQILAAGEARATRIHDRIDTIEGELRQLPSQIIALLNNARITR